MRHLRSKLLTVAVALVMPAALQAQLVTFTGFDAGAAAPGANSIASRNAFVAATGGTIGVDFEAGMPTNPAITGPQVSRKNTPGCAAPLCGGNTTAGGQWFLEIFGQTATMTFAAPIDYFGAYFGGLQITNNTMNFTDINGAQSIVIPNGGNAGGFGFVGFTSAGSSITSVSFNMNNDIVSVDDLIFGSATVVPEPGTYALVLAGLGMIGAARARRRQRA